MANSMDGVSDRDFALEYMALASILAVHLSRLAEEQPAGDGALADAPVRWSLQGETRDVRGGAHQIWLHLQAHARTALVCQRCLTPFDYRIDSSTQLVLAPGLNQSVAVLPASSTPAV